LSDTFLGRTRAWVAEKLNPVQPSIARDAGYQVPETIVDYERAYRDVEVIRINSEVVRFFTVLTSQKLII